MRTLCLTLTSIYAAFAAADGIDEARFVEIGGIQQWVTIQGADSTKPVILFLHGGPGSPLSPYAENIFGAWKQDYVLVQWDQRGAGRTFGKNAPEEVDEAYWIANPLTLEQMTQDGIAVAEYVIKRLPCEKVILFGSSWGSALGTRMALARPDLFQAYIGHAQMVQPKQDLVATYAALRELAVEREDQAAVAELDTLGAPPYVHPKNAGQLLRLIKRYERSEAVPAPGAWWEVAEEYAGEADSRDRYNGDDYSFVCYMGFEPLGITGMIDGIDFLKDGTRFEVPVYFVQGELDLLTAKERTDTYYRQIEAPAKGYYAVPGAEHNFNEDAIAQVKWVLDSLVKAE